MMKKLLLSTMLLAGVSFSFAKGTPVKTEKGEEIITSNNTTELKSSAFDSEKKLYKLSKKEMCKDVHFFVVDDPEEEDGFKVDGPYEVIYECDKETLSLYLWL